MNTFRNLVDCYAGGRLEDWMFSNTDIFVSTLELYKVLSLFVYISNICVAERLCCSQKTQCYF